MGRQLNGFAQQVAYAMCFRHLYQPPRWLPWLPNTQFIPPQRSAPFPFNDWNEAIYAQVIAPGCAAPVLENGYVRTCINTFAQAGDFDVSPTILDWLRLHHPDALRKLIAADRQSIERFRCIDGKAHGNAIVQAAHGHLILPLCCDKDLETQILWAIANFRFYFKRKPEGAWPPEAAVNIRVLEALAKHGIKYVILGQHQARRFRHVTSDDWTEAGFEGDCLNSRRPYVINLPTGAQMVVLFYNHQVSKRMAFSPHIVNDAHQWVSELVGSLDANGEKPQLMFGGADAELFGHHQPRAFMGLAKAIELLNAPGCQARLINGSAFLARTDCVEWEVELYEDSSWSCHHGVGRWHRDCGCGSDGNGSQQRWRQPVRSALDWLRDQVHSWCDSKDGGKRYFPKPWLARDDFIQVMLNLYSKESKRWFVKKHLRKGLGEREIRQGFMIMEILSDLMSAYTSCGWFFESMREEMGQNLLFAARAILQMQRFGVDLEPQFVRILECAPDNRCGNGGAFWNADIRPYALLCELTSLLKELRYFPHIETLARANTLAVEVSKLTGSAFVKMDDLQRQLQQAYGKMHGRISKDAKLGSGFADLSRNLGMEFGCLKERYSEDLADAARLASLTMRRSRALIRH